MIILPQKTVRVPVESFHLNITSWQRDILQKFDERMVRFFLIVWHRRARKTTLAINILIKECCKNPQSRYGYITSTYTAAKNIVWRDPNMLKRYLPMDFVSKFNESELFVEFKNKTILSLHGADSPDGIRGIDFSGVVIDEAALCKRELWEEILRPIIAQNLQRWAIFIATPKGKNWIYEYWIKMMDNPEWYRHLLTADESGIINKEELEKMKKEIPQAAYEQEMLCSFNENAAGVFKNTKQCICGNLEEYNVNKTYVTGVDLAKVQDWTVLTTICRETRHVVAFHRFNKVDWSYQKEMILSHVNKYNSLCVIDSTGLGSPIAEDLSKSGVSVVNFNISSQSKNELIEKLMICIEQRLITFPFIEKLIEELDVFQYDLTNAGNVRFSAPEGCHDDCVISLALAVHGLKSFIYGKKEKDRRSIYSKYSKDENFQNAGIGF